MKALDRKIFRELRGMKSQVITIAAVVAAGIALFVSSQSSYDSLSRARDQFYTGNNFAGGFSSLKKAPRTLLPQLSAVDGIAAIEARITQEAALDFPEEKLPSAARFVSLPENLSVLSVRSGKLPEANNEVILSEAFATANHLGPGSRLAAILNGKRQILKVSGTALSPEFVYIFRPSTFLPDDKHYGIAWLRREAMEVFFDFGGSFNDLAFTFAPGANIRHSLKSADTLLEPYGGFGAYDRNKLPSYAFLRDEFKQLRTNAYFLPLIFLGVAVFLLHIVATRLISRQREQIASLMALGYSKRQIALHYTKLMLLISGGGAIIGVAAGGWLGGAMTRLYGDFYRFPNLTYLFSFSVACYGFLTGCLAGSAGTWFSVRRVLRMQPAEAMRPPVPESFARSFFERWSGNMPVIRRMFLRNLLKRPLRTALSILGLSTSVMIMVLGLFMTDVMDSIVGTYFDVVSRENMTVAFLRPVSAEALHELLRQPGIQIAEGFRQVPVRLRKGQFSKELAVTGIQAGAQLRRIADQDRRVIDLPVSGVLLNAQAAKKLGLRPGDSVDLEFLEGNRQKHRVTVSALVDEIIGQGCYMLLEDVNRLLGEDTTITGAALRVDPLWQEHIIARLKDSSLVASIATREATLRIFYEMMSRSMLTMITLILIFAAAISVGVVYNTAMILLSERTFELGSLRILGFRKIEVFEMIASELGVVVLASLIPGCFLGYGLALLIMNTVDTEEFSLRLMISNRTYVTAMLTATGTAALSFVILFFRIRKMDLVAVLKVRE